MSCCLGSEIATHAARGDGLTGSGRPLVSADVAIPCDLIVTMWLRTLVPRSRHRARRSGFPHDLPDDQGRQLFQRQKGLCAISGLPFSLTEFADVLVKHPFAPSLDRISSRGGYTVDNVRLVCIAVNFGMGQWGEELYLTFARAAVERSGQVDNIMTVTANADLRPSSPNDDVDPVAIWLAAQRERLAAAEGIASTLSGEPLLRQRRRTASLKRNLTLGPDGLKAAAAKAVRTRAG